MKYNLKKINRKLKKIADILKKKHMKITISESCTGGMLGAMITSIPGSSAFFSGGIIAYSNAVKEQFGVSGKTLAHYGAVSVQTAREMASSIRDKMNSDIGIGITGIAGPGGSTKKKPVGLVYIALSTKKIEQVKQFIFNGRRSMIRRQACEKALDIIVDYLVND